MIAPDYPGYGFSAAPMDAPWTFDWLAEITNGLLEQLGLARYAMYMFDFGAPVGFRIAVAHPDRVAGIVTQNGNIYTDGFGPGVAALASWWQDRAKGQADVDGFLTLAGTRLQWEAGARDVSAIDPAIGRWTRRCWTNRAIRRPLKRCSGTTRTILARYPEFQAYLREHQPPLTAVWGKNDPFFIPPGAEAYKRDVPDAEIVLLDTGHFALAEEAAAIADHVHALLRRAYA